MENSRILAHVSFGTNHFNQAVKFYDEVMATIGAKRILDYTEHGAVAYGKQLPEFWIQTPYNDLEANYGNGCHVSFNVQTKEEVDAFYKAAMKMGGIDDGAPGPRPLYGENYYGCFVRDLDGNKIEAKLKEN